MHPIDRCHARLHGAGWSVGEATIATAAGLAWLVTGANGENVIEARGKTQTDAWENACRQAKALGMLRG